MLSTLAADPAATAAPPVVAQRLAGASPGRRRADGPGSHARRAADPADLATFLAEELGIGDAEDAVAALRSQLADPACSTAPEDYEMLFESVVAMQKDLSRRRMAHEPARVRPLPGRARKARRLSLALRGAAEQAA